LEEQLKLKEFKKSEQKRLKEEEDIKEELRLKKEREESNKIGRAHVRTPVTQP
jgi:hypothetical protein